MKRSILVTMMLTIALLCAPLVPAQQSALKLPPYKKVKLNNGLTLLLMEQREVPIVSFSFGVRAGSVSDPAGKEGVASITAALLRKGTKTRTADQFSAELDFIGGQFGAGAASDLTTGGAEFLKKDTAKGLELLADVMLNPTFPQEEFTKLIKQRVDGIKAAKDQASGIIGNYFNAYLFGDHPYGRPAGGDERSLAAIKREDVTQFYSEYYTPAGTILAVVGDFTAPEMEKMIAARFGQWKGTVKASGPLPEPRPSMGKRLLLIDKPDSTQTFYTIGNVGIARTNADRVYIGVVNTLFGGRFTSMLNTELRIKSGLSYGARSTFDERKTKGPFFISTFTSNATTEKAVDLTLEVLKRLHEKGVTEEELKSAKTYLKGQFPPDIETSDQLAGLLTGLEFYGLDERDVNEYYARIDSMTVADATRVIKQYFPLDNLVFVMIGKASEIQGVVKKYADKIDTKIITTPGF